MPRNGTGQYNPPVSTWNPPVLGVLATNVDWAALLTDLSNGLTQSLSKDGQTAATGNLQMGGFKLTGLGDGTVAGDSLAYGQSIDGMTFLADGADAVERPANEKMGDTLSVLDRDGADFGEKLNAAIVYANSLGGGTVIVPGGSYTQTTPIELLSGVVVSAYGATIAWTGGASAQVTSATTGVLEDAGILGGLWNGGSTATKIIELYSPYHCVFRDVAMTSNSATNVCVEILGNTTGGTNRHGNRNAAYCEFSNLTQDGTCGTFVRLYGTSTVFITLNTFLSLNASGVSVRGIDFAQWCDSNYFSGMTRVNLVANNAVGVEWNSADPTNNAGVYANNFDHLAVDTFGVMTGRVGFKMNYTKFNKIAFYFNDPQAEGGPYLISGDCQSYDFYHQPASTANLIHRRLLSYEQGSDEPIFGISAGGDISTQTVGAIAGVNRTGSGNAYFRLVGDTTYSQYGFQMLRGSTGANANSTLSARGTGNLTIFAEDAGGQIILQSQSGAKLVASNTGLGFYGTAATAKQSISGSRGGNAALADLLTKLAAIGLVTDGTTA